MAVGRLSGDRSTGSTMTSSWLVWPGALATNACCGSFAAAPVEDRKFLGYRLHADGRLTIAPKSLDRLKDRLRKIIRRNRSVPLARMIEEVNPLIAGWVNYFRFADASASLRSLDQWLRRKLRCVRLKHCKLPRTIAAFLWKRGVHEGDACRLATSGKGWWRLACTPQAHKAMPIQWFRELGLHSFVDHFDRGQRDRKPPRYGTVCQVV